MILYNIVKRIAHEHILMETGGKILICPAALVVKSDIKHDCCVDI